MDIKELIISIFENKVGPLRSKREKNYRDCSIIEFEFNYKDKIDLQILLIENTPHHWFLHHNLTFENPFLLKEIAYLCERIQRIKDNKKTSLKISDDLKEINEEMFIKTAIRSLLQNLLNKTFTMFGNNLEKPLKIHNPNIKVELGK